MGTSFKGQRIEILEEEEVGQVMVSCGYIYADEAKEVKKRERGRERFLISSFRAIDF